MSNTQRIDKIFEKVAQKIPKSVAVIEDGRIANYEEIYSRSCELASRLTKIGVGPGCVVGVLLERSIDAVVALIGVLQSGSAYLPLDPNYPKDRLEFMTKDSGAKVIISKRGISDSFAYSPDVCSIFLDGDITCDSGICRSTLNPSTRVDTAYVIYTSGTTGRPKGVACTHANISNFFQGIIEDLRLTRNDIFLSITSTSFDPHTLEIILPLILGARTVLVSDSKKASPDCVADIAARNEVSVIQATPATWKMLIDNGWKPSRPIKALCGGDAMTESLKNELLSLCGLSLWNVYGPTETTVWCSTKEMKKRHEVCIGPPMRNVRFFVLDENMKEVSIGHIGELYVGGPGLSPGYHNRPELNKERFVFTSLDPLSRIYRTGDIVRRRSDGCLDFLGRKDFQIKVRGFRVELLEIEAVIENCPVVAEAAVIADQDNLVAFFRMDSNVVNKPSNIISEVRAYMRKVLPTHMVPSVFQIVDAMPLTPNFKVDRIALLEMWRSRLGETNSDTEAATFDDTLKEIWSELLGVKNLCGTDRYSEVGGNSLNVIRLCLRIKEIWDVDVSIVELNRNETLSGMSQIIHEKLADCNKLEAKHIERKKSDIISTGLAPSQLLLLEETSKKSITRNNIDFLIHTRMPIKSVLQAGATLLNRHDVFSISQIVVDGQCEVLDFKSHSNRGVEDATDRYRDFNDFLADLSEIRASINPLSGKLWRCIVFGVSDSAFLYFIGNHLILDDVSVQILKDELDVLLSNPNVSLPSSISYSQWIRYHNNALIRGEYDDEIEYWKSVMKKASRTSFHKSVSHSVADSINRVTWQTRNIRLDREKQKIATAQRAHEAVVACCSWEYGRYFGFSNVPCRLVGAGRGILDQLNDSFTIGWLAYHYPVVIKLGENIVSTYNSITSNRRNLPTQGIGFGWLRFVQRNKKLCTGPQLVDFPVYINYLPRYEQLRSAYFEQALPPMPEARSDVVGISFVVEHFPDQMEITAVHKPSFISERDVSNLLDSIESSLHQLFIDKQTKIL